MIRITYINNRFVLSKKIPMAKLIKPISITLDTSILNSVANDFYSTHKDKQKKAKEFISFINSNGYVPLISFDHIVEFLQTPIESDARKSFEIISQFSNIFWIISKSSFGLLVGNVYDIIGSEIKAYLDGIIDFSEIISITKERSFAFGTGKEFVEMHSIYWCQLRTYSIYNKQRKKEMASILNIESLVNSETKISEFIKYKLNNSDEVKKKLESLKLYFIEQIAKKGDRKLNDPQCVAFNFHSIVSNDVNQSIELGEPGTIEELCRLSGFSEEDLTECSTVGELCELASFRDQLKTYAKINKINPKELNHIRPKNIPSVKMVNGISEICRKGKPRASGSDLVDNELISLTLYCDYSVLDKRTLVFLKQYLNAVPMYKELVNGYFKLPNYAEFNKYVPIRE